jgi:hypothetical protein
MTIPKLQHSAAVMRKFQEDLAKFEVELQRLWGGKHYTGTEWMAGPQPRTAMSELGPGILQTLGPLRDNVGKSIDDVTHILNAYGVPTIWKMYPPPAVGGLVKSANAFRAFIDLEIETDERPSFLKTRDLVSQGIWRAQKEIEELTAHPPTTLSKMKVIPKWIIGGLGWLFPTEKQRGVLGWVIIAAVVGLILRRMFGIQLEDVGKLLSKWFAK